ncbi:MAG TPA: hypothetical protein VHW66_04995 [Stellaceae bacterium]|jgi:hypothetical protein|nr:hypothetical protein [Stellaceae bacterium]
MRLGPVVFVLALVAALPAWADGTVFRATGCGDKIYVTSLTGFSVLTGIGGAGVADKDELVGKVDGIGHTQLYDKTKAFNFSADVEDRRLSREEALPRIATTCRGQNANALASGTVTRAEGCGNRIFVSAPQGVAVLNRLAGGLVGKDDQVSGDFNKPGRATIKDKQTGSEVTVFVEDYMLSQAAANRKMTALCTTAR